MPREFAMGLGRKIGKPMRTNNFIILFLAIVMGGIAAFMARHWLEAHAITTATGQSVGTIVVAAQPLGFGAAVTTDTVMEIPWAANALPEGAFVSKDDLLKD